MPHHVDVHVGRRIRIARTLLGQRQAELAGQLGITFQQLQKYESGTNRVSASRLWHIAKILDTRIEWFFEGLESDAEDPATVMAMPGTVEFVRDVERCPPRVRSAVRAALSSIATNEA